MRPLFFAFAIVFASTPLFAQTAPCDLTYPTTGTAVAGQAVTLAACSASKDVNGTPVTITGWALYDNGVRTTPTLVADPVVSATGFRSYSVSLAAPAAGVHTYTLAGLTALGEGPASAPFVLTVSPAPTVLAAPIKLRVQ